MRYCPLSPPPSLPVKLAGMPLRSLTPETYVHHAGPAKAPPRTWIVTVLALAGRLDQPTRISAGDSSEPESVICCTVKEGAATGLKL